MSRRAGVVDGKASTAAGGRTAHAAPVGQAQGQLVGVGIEVEAQRKEIAVLVRRDELVIGLDQRELAIVTDAGAEHVHALRVQELGGFDMDLAYLRDRHHRCISLRLWRV